MRRAYAAAKKHSKKLVLKMGAGSNRGRRRLRSGTFSCLADCRGLWLHG